MARYRESCYASTPRPFSWCRGRTPADCGPSAARAEPLHADHPGGHSLRDQKPTCRFGERVGTAYVAGGCDAYERRQLSRGKPATRTPARRVAVIAVLAGQRDQRPGGAELVGVGQLGRASAPRRRAAAGPCGRRAIAWRSIATSGTTPEPPADPERRRVSRPRRTSRRSGPRTSSSSPGCDDVGEEARHLAVLEPLDVELEQRIGRRGGDRVRALRDVAVLGGQPDRRSAGRAGGRPGRAPRGAA